MAGLLAISVAGCGWSEPPRAQLAEEVAGTFAAAAATLEALHEGRTTSQYLEASFEAFRERAMQSIAELRSFDLDPELVGIIDRAAAALSAPCLEPGCDWQGQGTVLRKAAKDLLASASP